MMKNLYLLRYWYEVQEVWKMVNYVTHNKPKAVHSNQSYRKGPTRGKARGRRDYTMFLKKLRKEAA